MTRLSLSIGLIDKLVNGCQNTILSLSLGAIYNSVIEPCFYLQSCYWALEPFTILLLSPVSIYNPVIEPRNHLQSCHWAQEPFTILSLSLRTIYMAHLLLPDQGSGFICAWWQCILQFRGCCGLPQGLPTAYTLCGMYIVCIRGYIWIFWCFLEAWFQQKLIIHPPCPGS